MDKLHKWFREQKRDFPWRENPSPYRVWVSEVMLQQTRASVVVPYFERFLNLFPDVFALASAEIGTVIKVWEGLGYYSRARNLHKGAQQIVRDFAGKIPGTREELSQIHGLGPYTVGAILSFGFRKRAAAVDGNVVRVISRLFSIEENVDRASGKKKVWERAEEILSQEEPWVTSEALIELGATVCKPKPDCMACPLKESCLGKDKAAELPIKNGEKEITHLKRAVAIIMAEGKVLVKRGEKGLMADLYEFPYFEERLRVETLGIRAEMVRKMKKTTSSFTRYKAELTPYLLKAEKCLPVEGYSWVEKETLQTLPFSAGHRRIYEDFASGSL